MLHVYIYIIQLVTCKHWGVCISLYVYTFVSGAATHHYLAWKKGVNAGGQPKHSSFPTNPQLKLKITGT